jgi:DNA-binding MarR family transcriptional regulator
VHQEGSDRGPEMKDAHDTGAPSGTKFGQFMTYRLARVQAKLNAQATRILRDHAGLTLTQWRLLALLGGAGQATAAQLSRHAAMDKGLISRNIRALTEEGLVQVNSDPADHRAQVLTLSPRGVSLFEHTLPRMRARQDALRAYLDANEEAVLNRALEKLERAAEDPTVG